MVVIAPKPSVEAPKAEPQKIVKKPVKKPIKK